mmetsp:Transcript_7530/g.22266  ORF Transcript_7530/g.22266 Transcript_7530/m.22266 type:complete len:150 (+) Transcript_7530:1978-2427(+)
MARISAVQHPASCPSAITAPHISRPSPTPRCLPVRPSRSDSWLVSTLRLSQCMSPNGAAVNPEDTATSVPPTSVHHSTMHDHGALQMQGSRNNRGSDIAKELQAPDSTIMMRSSDNRTMMYHSWGRLRSGLGSKNLHSEITMRMHFQLG